MDHVIFVIFESCSSVAFPGESASGRRLPRLCLNAATPRHVLSPSSPALHAFCWHPDDQVSLLRCNYPTRTWKLTRGEHCNDVRLLYYSAKRVKPDASHGYLAACSPGSSSADGQIKWSFSGILPLSLCGV